MNVENQKNEKKPLNETSELLNDIREMKVNSMLAQQNCNDNANKVEMFNFHFSNGRGK
jgi:hypothetical protein